MPSMLVHAGIAFACAAFVAVLLTPLVRVLGQHALDRPDGRRKVHVLAVPRTGGVAVMAAVGVTCGAFQLLDPSQLLGLPFLALLAVFLVGLADDVIGVSPVSKFVVQAAAALLMFVAGVRIEILGNPFGAPVHLGVFALPVTMLWFVGMSNAVNLIDGLDGLAAGISLFATLTFFLSAVLNDRWELVIPMAALGGALLGFLRYNFNPASIFLGDAGSLSIGFLLAAFAVSSSMKSSAAVAVSAPLMTLALPLLDTLLSIVRRLMRGQPISEGDANHIHHRLLGLGMTPRRAALSMYAAAGLLGMASLLAASGTTQVTAVVLAVVSCTAWLGIQQLGYAEFGEVNRIVKRGLFHQRRIVMNNLRLLDVRAALRQATTLAEVWRQLTDLAERLGFTSANLCLEPRTGEGVATDGGAPLKWQREGADPRQWTWAVPVFNGDVLLATVVFQRPLAEGSVYFELGYLLDVVRNDLSAALATCTARGSAAPEASTGARPVDNPRLAD